MAPVHVKCVWQLLERAGPWQSLAHPLTWVRHCAPAGDSACPVHPRCSLVYPLLFHCQDRGRCAGSVSPMGFPSGSYELGSHLSIGPAWLGDHWLRNNLGCWKHYGPLLNHAGACCLQWAEKGVGDAGFSSRAPGRPHHKGPLAHCNLHVSSATLVLKHQENHLFAIKTEQTTE